MTFAFDIQPKSFWLFHVTLTHYVLHILPVSSSGLPLDLLLEPFVSVLPSLIESASSFYTSSVCVLWHVLWNHSFMGMSVWMRSSLLELSSR